MSNLLVGVAVAFVVSYCLSRWYWPATAARRNLRRAEADLKKRNYRLPDPGSAQRAFVVARHAYMPWRSQADMDAGVHWLEREGGNGRANREVLRRLR